MMGMREEFSAQNNENELLKRKIQELEKNYQFVRKEVEEEKIKHGDVDVEELVVENGCLKDLTEQLKKRLERAIGDLEFYRKIVREHKMRES